MTFPKLKRLDRLTEFLNENKGVPKTYSQIYRYLIRYDSAEFCLSTLEKDIFCLRMDFDIDIKRAHQNYSWIGICIDEEVDFFDRLKKYLE
jgi:hypothetical protein